MSVACVFPGQGSQSRGMGADLFGRFPEWTAEADRILGYSIAEVCTHDPRGELKSTHVTQPALFVVNAMTYRTRMESGAERPAFLAGHSLGEFNALLAAGVFDFSTGLQMVRRRGELMAQVTGGGMTAVVGMSPERIEAALAESEAGRRIDIANFNSIDQVVVAGRSADLAAVAPDLKAAGARACIPLKVSAPFHSRYMREPMLEFAGFISTFELSQPSIPVVANATARPYEPDAVRETLSRQIGSSVRWLESVRFLLEHGATDFEEMGPGKVLTKLIAQIRASGDGRPAPS
jgi:malonyl CoA-acyl carrier protein transacylase